MDVSVQVRAEDGTALPGQPLQNLLRGVPVSIAPRADANRLRPQGLQQLLRRGVPGAVVPGYQDLKIRQIVRRQELFLRGPVHVAGDQQIQIPGGGQDSQALRVVPDR